MRKVISLIIFILCLMACKPIPPTVDFSIPAFHRMIRDNKLEEVKELVNKKCSSDEFKDSNYMNTSGLSCFDPNLEDIYNNTALFLVGARGMAELLINEGADVNSRNRFQQTPLHVVANISLAKFLVEKGADIDAKDEDGKTPLYMAVRWKRYDIAEALFDLGANPHIADNDGRTPFSIATKYKLNKLIKKFKTYTPK